MSKINPLLSLTTSFTQPKKNPNLLPVHMESRISQHTPAQPSTINSTRTTYVSFAHLKFQSSLSLPSLILLMLVLLLGMGVMAWLAYSIAAPINEMSSFTVTSATVDPFNISSSRLTAAWNISIYIKNYGMLGDMHFERVQSSIYYGSHLLSQVSIPCFFLETDRHKTLQDRLVAHSKSLDMDAAESMFRDRLLRGAVDFRVELLARANGDKFNISCENVTVGFLGTPNVGPGFMLGPPRKCIVLVEGKTKKRD